MYNNIYIEWNTVRKTVILFIWNIDYILIFD
jgi:hypothetical protein